MSDQVTLRAPEVRTYSALELRDVERSESGKWLEGRAVPYGEWTDVGWFMERMSAGVFSKSIKEAARDLPLLLWHNSQTFPIGSASEWRESDGGLDGVWRLDHEDPVAVEAARKAANGLLTGMSVGFAPIPEQDDIDLDENGLPWITRKEGRLLEVSLTPTPAYAGANVALVRSRMPHEQGKRRRSAEVDAWKSYLGTVRR